MTEKEYIEGFQFLKEHFPDNELIADLETGYNRFNVLYLKAALAELAKMPVVIQKNGANGDETGDKLQFQKSQLFVKRFKLTNSLHGFPLTPQYNPHRAGVVDAVKVVQTEIEKVFRAIEYYEANHALPPERLPDDEFPIPQNIYDRKKKLDSVQSSAWQCQQKMNDAIGHDQTATAVELGARIDKYNIHIQMLKNSLAADGVVIKTRVKK